MFKTIVIATDGSAHAERAFVLAEALAAEDKARLVVVHVTELVGGKGGVFPAAADEDEIRTDIETRVADMNRDGMTADAMTVTVHRGGPAHAIAEVADTVDADLIVVGSRGHSPASEVLLGGVPIRLMHIAHRPILVVPPVRGQ